MTKKSEIELILDVSTKELVDSIIYSIGADYDKLREFILCLDEAVADETFTIELLEALNARLSGSL